MTVRLHACPAIPAIAFWDAPGLPEIQAVVDLVCRLGLLARWTIPFAKRVLARVKRRFSPRKRPDPPIKPDPVKAIRSTVDRLFYLSGRQFLGWGRLLDENRFALEPGTIVSPGCAASLPPKIRRLRRECARLIDENHMLTERIVFDSPSAAAMFVTGCSTNGRCRWRDSTGRSLSETAPACRR
jgi:hypothetical protein